MPPEILEIQPHNNGTSHFCETEIEPFPYITKLRIAFCRPQFLFYPNLLMLLQILFSIHWIAFQVWKLVKGENSFAVVDLVPLVKCGVLI